MPLFLSQRAANSHERMDDPDCDPVELENTYRQFGTINTLLSQWRKIYTGYIRPYLQNGTSNSLLDVGYGGGDIPIKLAQWAWNDGLDLQITAIDPDPRTYNYIRKIERPPNIEFLTCGISEMDPATRRFDFVISNHLLHHLNSKQLDRMLEQSRKLSSKAVIFNDGRRSDLAYLLFNILSRPVFRSSFITADGLTSIRRSYTCAELKEAAPENWKVKKLFPFRLLLMYHHE